MCCIPTILFPSIVKYFWRDFIVMSGLRGSNTWRWFVWVPVGKLKYTNELANRSEYFCSSAVLKSWEIAVSHLNTQYGAIFYILSRRNGNEKYVIYLCYNVQFHESLVWYNQPFVLTSILGFPRCSLDQAWNWLVLRNQIKDNEYIEILNVNSLLRN